MARKYPYNTSFRQARWFYKGRRRKVRALVIHTAEGGELPNSAENVANYFATTTRSASAHVTFDANSCAGSVDFADTAFAAKGISADGIHFEHAGRARQTAADWADPYSQRMLTRSAIGAAWVIKEFGLRPVYMTDAELRGGKATGITLHSQASKVWPSNGHWDPGPHFPAGQYLALIKKALAGELGMRVEKGLLVITNGGIVLPPVTAPAPPLEELDRVPVTPAPGAKKWRTLSLTAPAMAGADVKRLQNRLGLFETGVYDAHTALVVALWQKETYGISPADPQLGIVGAFTAKKLGLIT